MVELRVKGEKNLGNPTEGLNQFNTLQKTMALAEKKIIITVDTAVFESNTKTYSSVNIQKNRNKIYLHQHHKEYSYSWYNINRKEVHWKPEAHVDILPEISNHKDFYSVQ